MHGLSNKINEKISLLFQLQNLSTCGFETYQITQVHDETLDISRRVRTFLSFI